MNEKKCREIVRERSQNRCERCGTAWPVPSHHHRLKRSAGGRWEPFNIGALCGSGTTGCHSWVEHNPNEAESEGWHCRPWQEPADIPVLYRGKRALLTNDGRVEYLDGE